MRFPLSPKRPLRLAAMAAGLALSLAACGGGGSGSTDVASLAGGQKSGAAAEKTSAKKASKDPEQAMLDFARCMRDHGIDMPDPQISSGAGKPSVAISLTGDSIDKATME